MNPADEVPAGFATLQQLRTENRITESQYVFFHNRYRRLNRLVCATLSSEKSLLSRVQDFHKSVSDANSSLEEEKNTFAENQQNLDNVKSSLDLKTKSLREQEQESDILTLTQESLNRELSNLEDELKNKKNESQRLLQPMVTDLENFIQNLTGDIENFQNQIKQAEVDKVKNEKNIQTLALEIEQLHVVNAKKRKELTNIKAEPERVELETGITQRKLRGLELEVGALETENTTQENIIEKSKETRKTKTNELLEVGDSLIRLQDEINAKQENITEFKKQLDQEKLKTSSYIEERMQMASDISLLKNEYKIENHSFLTSKKGLQSKKKEYEKLRRDKELSIEQIKKLNEEKKSLERSIEDIEKQTTQTRKILKEGLQDFEEKLLQYLQDASKHGKSNEELINMKLLLEACQENMQKVLEFNKELTEQVVNLKADRFQLVKKTNDVHIAHRTDEEILKSKELVVMDLGKKDEMLKSRLTECRKTYQMVKKSKNRFANLTSNCNQALAEIQEKIKIVQNECEILKNESLSKDRALIEEARILNSAKHTRDSLRFEQLQTQKQLQELNEVVRTQTMNIEQFQNIIKGIDGEMLRSRQKFGIAMEKRNKTGLQVINRNDEMCVLHEKRSIFQDILNQGKTQCQRLKDEIRMLCLDLKNVQMSIEATKRNIPSQETEKKTERIFYNLKAEIKDHEKLVEKLSVQLEIQTPELNKQRFRKVKGTDASMEQLESKIAVLDARTNVQNESILEKKMMLEEVSMLTEKLESQAENGKEQTLLLAKTINQYQSKIKQLTRKLMANVAELAMYQATALKLEQEIDERKHELEGAQEALKEGQPPSDRATHQWLRIQRDRIFATSEIMESMYIGDDEVESRCERRVDSYIDPLSGIPKPYGGHAPFKPSRLGSNLRHFRQPMTASEAALNSQLGTN